MLNVCVGGRRRGAPLPCTQAGKQAGRPHIAHSYSVRIPDKEN